MWRLCSQNTCGLSYKAALLTSAPFRHTLLSSCSLPFSLIAALRACGSTLSGNTSKTDKPSNGTTSETTNHTSPSSSSSTSAMDVQTYGGPFGRFKEAEKAAQAQEDGAIPFSDTSSSLLSHGCDCSHAHSDVIGNSSSGGGGGGNISASSSGSSKLSKLDRRVIKSDDEVAASEPERHFRPRTTFGDFSNVELQSDNIDDMVAAMAAATSSSSSSSKSIRGSQNKSTQYHAHDGSMSSVTGQTPSDTISSQQHHQHQQRSENKHASDIDLHDESLRQSEISAEEEKTRHALEEIQRFLAQSTLHSLQSSRARENAEAQAGYPRLPPGHRGVQTLLDYNKQWAHEMTKLNPGYFKELAKEQKPEYLWIGCSDSRVPANEVVGLHPGDVFVHRNIGNIFSLSDLNCLSALQFAVDCLKVQHVIIAGHYKCGGVTAAMRGDNLGLTDHWIMQVTDIKNKWWGRVTDEIPVSEHLSVLCELNVLEQLSHLANCRILQRRWRQQNEKDGFDVMNTPHVFVRPHYAKTHHLHYATGTRHAPQLPSALAPQQELEVHGWVYSLDDGMLRPLLTLTRFCDIKKKIATALEAVFIRYSQMHEKVTSMS